MSHFTVLVVTDTGPLMDGDPTLKEALQPFHEFECTGDHDEYIVWIDEHDEFAAEFDGYTTHIPYVFDAAGNPVASKYDDRFKAQGIRTESDPFPSSTFCVPDGMTVKSVAPCEVYGSMREYMEDWHGYGDDHIDENGRFGRWTNPNAKWDWWTVGGRWGGSLTTKGGSKVNSWMWGGIDIDAMRSKAERDARRIFAVLSLTIGDAELPDSWASIRDRSSDINAAREEFNTNAAVVRLSENKEFLWDQPYWIEVYRNGLDSYVAQERAKATQFFAILKDGVWHERGEMGWFGFVSNEKETDRWNEEYASILESIKPEQFVTVVDCHI